MPREVIVSESHDPLPRVLGDSKTHHERAEISLLDVMIVLVGRKRTILSIAIGFTLLAIVTSLLLPLQYAATSTILPPQQSSSMGALASQLGSMGGAGMAALAGSSLGIKNPNDMLVALMKSRSVEDSMVQRFGLVQEYHARNLSQARKAFESNVIVDGSGKDGLIRVTVKDRNPKRAEELTNGYVDQFRNLSAHLAITEASQRRLFYEQQLEDAKNNLANAEEAMKRTEQQTGVIQPESQARALIESAASLRGQITAKEVQIQSLKTFATDQNAQLVQAEQELEGLRTQLGRLAGAENDPEALIMPRGRVPQAGMEYIRKLRDVKYYETIFEILARQYEMAKLDEAKQGALIQVVDRAVVPEERSSPHRTYIVLGGMVLGLLFGALTALFLSGWERMQQDQQIKQKLNTIRRELSFSHRGSSTGS